MCQCQRLLMKQAVVKYEMVVQRLTQFPFGSRYTYTRNTSRTSRPGPGRPDVRFAAAAIDRSKNRARSIPDPKLDWTGEYRGRKSFRADLRGTQNFPSGSSAVHRRSGWRSLVRAPSERSEVVERPFQMRRKIG